MTMESRIYSGISEIPQGQILQTLIAVHSGVPYVDNNSYSSLANLSVCSAERVQQKFCGVKKKKSFYGRRVCILRATSIYILRKSLISPQVKRPDYRYLFCAEGIKSLIFVLVSPKSALYLAAG